MLGKNNKNNIRISTKTIIILILGLFISKLYLKLKNIIIAYEPGYLIGNNSTYNLAKIKEMIQFIKHLTLDYYQINVPVVFGGSINKENIDYLLNLNILDGFIICSSILNPENITKIIQKMTTQ